MGVGLDGCRWASTCSDCLRQLAERSRCVCHYQRLQFAPVLQQQEADQEGRTRTGSDPVAAAAATVM